MMGRRRYRNSKPTWVTLVIAVIAVVVAAANKFNLEFPGGFSEGKERRTAGAATGEIEMHCIDVGQGDAILIQTENHNILVDAGENDYGQRVTEYLQNEGVDKLSLVIGTHPHSDHIGGIDTVLENIDADTLVMGDYDYDTKTYYDVVDIAQEQGIDYIRMNEDMSFTFDDALFEIFVPVAGFGDDINECSLWLMVTHGDNRYLMYGDGGQKSERDMIDAGVDLSADVLKCAHHGSSDATSDRLLEAVEPDYVAISVGYDNSYNHPHYETINKFKKIDINPYRTDKNGNIVFTGDGENITVTTSK